MNHIKDWNEKSINRGFVFHKFWHENAYTVLMKSTGRKLDDVLTDPWICEFSTLGLGLKLKLL